MLVPPGPWSLPFRFRTEIRRPPEFGEALPEQLQPLALQVWAGVVRQPRDVPAGPRQTRSLLSGVGEEGPGFLRASPPCFSTPTTRARSSGISASAVSAPRCASSRANAAGCPARASLCPPGRTRRSSSSSSRRRPSVPSPTSTCPPIAGDRARVDSPAVDFTDLRCQPFTLPFELPGETAGLDFRTRSYGAALSLCRVVVRKSPP
jgi:hypothetical protein